MYKVITGLVTGCNSLLHIMGLIGSPWCRSAEQRKKSQLMFCAYLLVFFFFLKGGMCGGGALRMLKILGWEQFGSLLRDQGSRDCDSNLRGTKA
jgi:hypothetical protein